MHKYSYDLLSSKWFVTNLKTVCSCSKCLEGIFTECLNEAGSEIQVKYVSNNNENDSDYEDSVYEE